MLLEGLLEIVLVFGRWRGPLCPSDFLMPRKSSKLKCAESLSIELCSELSPMFRADMSGIFNLISSGGGDNSAPLLCRPDSSNKLTIGIVEQHLD